MPHYTPYGASVDHFEGFLEDKELDVHWWLPLQWLFLYDAQCYIWSMQELPALKPACFSLNVAFGISSSILVRTLLGIDNSWIPLQLWQSHKSPFLGSLTIWPVFHSGDFFLLPVVLSSPCIIRADVAVSSLNALGGMLSGPGDFPPWFSWWL